MLARAHKLVLGFYDAGVMRCRPDYLFKLEIVKLNLPLSLPLSLAHVSAVSNRVTIDKDFLQVYAPMASARTLLRFPGLSLPCTFETRISAHPFHVNFLNLQCDPAIRRVLARLRQENFCALLLARFDTRSRVIFACKSLFTSANENRPRVSHGASSARRLPENLWDERVMSESRRKSRKKLDKSLSTVPLFPRRFEKRRERSFCRSSRGYTNKYVKGILVLLQRNARTSAMYLLRSYICFLLFSHFFFNAVIL